MAEETSEAREQQVKELSAVAARDQIEEEQRKSAEQQAQEQAFATLAARQAANRTSGGQRAGNSQPLSLQNIMDNIEDNALASEVDEVQGTMEELRQMVTGMEKRLNQMESQSQTGGGASGQGVPQTQAPISCGSGPLSVVMKTHLTGKGATTPMLQRLNGLPAGATVNDLGKCQNVTICGKAGATQECIQASPAKLQSGINLLNKSNERVAQVLSDKEADAASNSGGSLAKKVADLEKQVQSMQNVRKAQTTSCGSGGSDVMVEVSPGSFRKFLGMGAAPTLSDLEKCSADSKSMPPLCVSSANTYPCIMGSSDEKLAAGLSMQLMEDAQGKVSSSPGPSVYSITAGEQEDKPLSDRLANIEQQIAQISGETAPATDCTVNGPCAVNQQNCSMLSPITNETVDMCCQQVQATPAPGQPAESSLQWQVGKCTADKVTIADIKQDVQDIKQMFTIDGGEVTLNGTLKIGKELDVAGLQFKTAQCSTDIPNGPVKGYCCTSAWDGNVCNGVDVTSTDTSTVAGAVTAGIMKKLASAEVTGDLNMTGGITAKTVEATERLSLGTDKFTNFSFTKDGYNTTLYLGNSDNTLNVRGSIDISSPNKSSGNLNVKATPQTKGKDSITSCPGDTCTAAQEGQSCFGSPNKCCKNGTWKSGLCTTGGKITAQSGISGDLYVDGNVIGASLVARDEAVWGNCDSILDKYPTGSVYMGGGVEINPACTKITSDAICNATKTADGKRQMCSWSGDTSTGRCNTKNPGSVALGMCSRMLGTTQQVHIPEITSTDTSVTSEFAMQGANVDFNKVTAPSVEVTEELSMSQPGYNNLSIRMDTYNTTMTLGNKYNTLKVLGNIHMEGGDLEVETTETTDTSTQRVTAHGGNIRGVYKGANPYTLSNNGKITSGSLTLNDKPGVGEGPCLINMPNASEAESCTFSNGKTWGSVADFTSK